MTVSLSSELVQAMLDHMGTIVYGDSRPFSFKDFETFTHESKQFTTKHGHIRDIFSALKKAGKIVSCYRSGPAFYTLPGQSFTRQPETVGGYGGVAAKDLKENAKTSSRKYRQAPNSDPIVVNELKRLQFDQRALHDIRFMFNWQGAWLILSKSTEVKLDPTNKELKLKPFRAKNDGTEIRITIHKTDNISVYLACSFAPVVYDYAGVDRLTTLLTRCEVYLENAVKEAAKAAGQEIEPEAPDHLTWICKHYHLGRDSLQEYVSDRFAVSYENMRDSLLRVYVKEFPDHITKLRVERLESPNKPVVDILNMMLDSTTGGKP